ncbi:MAG: hypothetical protein HQK65_01405, partial [Desulfamplus sp.]|nr:hypothetical protein [Desulfamplus sp.]
MQKICAVLSILTVCLILSATTLSIRTVEAQELKIAIFNFQPFYVDEEGQEPSGILVDYLKAALGSLNLPYSITGYPPKRAYKNLAEGKSDLFLGVKGVPDLEGNVLYSNNKITQIDLKIYTRQET